MKRIIFNATFGMLCITTSHLMSMTLLSTAKRFIAPRCVMVRSQSTFDSESKKLSNEEKIRKVLQHTFRTNWVESKVKITQLIEKGVNTIDVTEYDTWGYTPLCRAINQNDLQFTEYLLKKGANANDNIKGIHSTKPIFFAKSVEMVQLLEKYGAEIHVENTGSGVTGNMNLLHASIGCNTDDDRLFDYFLEREFNPKSLDNHGSNLWYSLVWISARYFPEEQLLARARKLHTLGIDPYAKNLRGVSAIDKVKEEVETETAYLNSGRASSFEIKSRTAARDKMQRLLNVMENTPSYQHQATKE